MKKAKILVVFLTSLALNISAQTKKPASPEEAKMNTFISNLMAKMTIYEKIGQLNLPSSGDITTGQANSSDIGKKIKDGQVGGLFNIKGVDKIKSVQKVAVEESRLKIPLLFGMDVIHGYNTVFPIPLGMSATWNMTAVEKSARVAAIEASASGINWTFSPMVDISRDPRWGRISEGSGEDAYLGSKIAAAMVKGYQGKLQANNEILACVKHYALYGAAEAGRDYNTTDMSKVRMYNEYFPPYKAAVDAGAASIMASFNEVDGIPATGSKWLMTDVLRNQWGFKGFVVTDYTGIPEMIAHGMGDLQTVSALAMNAGIDMDMVGEGFLGTLKKSLAEKKVSINEINRACRLILQAKYKLGLFTDPYKFCDPTRAEKEVFNAENRQIAREISAESFVLLKNSNNLLPLKKTGTIGLIGPLADNTANMYGTWSVAALFDQSVTVLQGLKNALGNDAKILTARGSNFLADSLAEHRYINVHNPTYKRDPRSEEEMIKEAVRVAEKSDVVIATMGEGSEFTGEASSVTDIQIPETQKNLLKALVKTGKPIVLVLFTGRPLALKWEQENIPAILNVWFPGSEAGNSIADALFGKVNPSGKLSATFPQNVGQVPLYYAHKNTGRPLAEGKWFEKFRSNYLDVSNDPLYPFGFGLSYTTFNYSDVKLSANTLTKGKSITASVTLSNTGKYDGKEVVQLYIRDLVGSITRPVKELKGFQKVNLKAGESKTISFNISENDLKFYNSDLKFVAEPGEFQVFIGTNSRDVKAASFTLK
ncbi:beta-glucosidase BglX [Pedobacter sp. MC2016-05]|uniref:beta-glucosidase BglX n=1 Tax=Pedobacter sp. MC2016-05 TaxID=2994474 RepID=UPI0022462370|nr:beta-glucosidase BglX [Pedobacter sp. MC2016-05]MCX2473933.1 beta-glucosidase BglX [Pedobacter sp. MC2016-05]